MDDMDKEEKKRLKEELRKERHMMFHRHNWLRRNAMVPKGFLRYHVLEALDKQPMSGSELMDQIYKRTGEAWKPSPGSIYPLLAFLQDNGYVKEIPTENGLKRYELTQSGRDLLEEQSKIGEKFSENAGFVASPFFGRMFSNIPDKKVVEIRSSMRRLMVSSMKLAKNMRKNYSEKDLDEALQALDEASTKIQTINERLSGEKTQ